MEEEHSMGRKKGMLGLQTSRLLTLRGGSGEQNSRNSGESLFSFKWTQKSQGFLCCLVLFVFWNIESFALQGEKLFLNPMKRGTRLEASSRSAKGEQVKVPADQVQTRKREGEHILHKSSSGLHAWAMICALSGTKHSGTHTHTQINK